jgi:aminoglycoside phosphotransferase (APT) family kinase protein
VIPEEKKPAVERALQEAFGVKEFEDLRELTAGLSSALVFRIVVRGRPYLLRVITRTDAMGDPTRQFACMKRGVDAGIAPRVWYASVEDRISITDFVEARPFSLAEARVRMPVTLRTLHALPAFPRVVNYFEFVDGAIKRFKAAQILPASETEELFQLYSRVQSVYPRQDSEWVASHNDLKPENVLFDGAHVWLVDWEAGFLNDRCFDLAVVANFVVTNDAEEKVYLRGYFGETVDEYMVARFFLMRQVVHMSYAMVFMPLGSAGKPVEANAKIPEFWDFHNRIWSGEISLATEAPRLEYGRVHLRQNLESMWSPRFEEALRIVASRTAKQ